MSTLIIPIDASQVAESDRKQQRVKVAVQSQGKVKSQVVSVEGGKAEIKLDVDPKQALSIAVGPESASDEDIFHLDTLTHGVSPAQWDAQKPLTIPAFALTPQWWQRWLFWCREFVINGKVVCPDGSPVPGAKVSAFDVDFFWWWSSINQVGSTVVTDVNGHFTINFRWCCGWFPWWWWELRFWQLNPILVDKIQPVLQLNPTLRFPEPSPKLELHVPGITTQVTTRTAAIVAVPAVRPPALPTAAALPALTKLEPSTIPALRERLTAALPHVPELEALRIWPWYPWTPWFDCAPDIIFRVTQNCGGGEEKTIVNETVFQTRWDIPTQLTVTLVANDQACCLPKHDPPPMGDCALITGVCGDPGIISAEIGGNPAHPGGPDGFEDPGGADRPFSEVFTINGQLGIDPQTAYYTIEYRPHGVGAFVPVPAAALQGFTRGYFDATAPFPNEWFYPGFPVQNFGTPNNVYESRSHYEAMHPPNNWGSVAGRTWFLNVNTLASIQTFGNFPDGAYDFQIRGFKALANGDLDPTDLGKVLPGCGDPKGDTNSLVLFIDNRNVGPQQPGNVHINTTEPDCGITKVIIGGSGIDPCGSQGVKPGESFEVDFFATDNPDGHLDHYEMNMLWGLGNIVDLLSFPGATLTNTSPAPDNQAGPTYALAMTQPGAVRPIWRGGNMKLVIPNITPPNNPLFPKTCCYLIELTVWKRNIVNCYGGLTYYNQMHYSFTVTV